MSLPKTESIDVSFAVPFTHRLRFTSDVLGDEQNVLLDLIQKSGDQLPRVQFWIDEYVAKADATLVPRIEKFVQQSADRLISTGPIQIAPGESQLRTTSMLRNACCKRLTPMTSTVAAM